MKQGGGMNIFKNCGNTVNIFTMIIAEPAGKDKKKGTKPLALS